MYKNLSVKGWFKLFCLGVALVFSGFIAAADGEDGSIKNHPGERAFSQYQNYQKAPVQSWEDSNKTVSEIGGWRSYARDIYRYKKQREK
ncbi:MAG: hypothetical protein ACO3FP_06470 [Burkholderiales bacterium]|jgi:hypothetical protein